MFNDIIALCHRRILGRLKSKHSAYFSGDKKSNKRFIGGVLREFMEKPWPTRITENSSLSSHVPRLDDYQSKLEHLLENLEAFEAANEYRHENLSRLVRSVAQALESVPIRALFDSLDNNDMNHHLRKWLHSCFAKIHRYSEVASILCHKARRIPMLRNMRVRIVSDMVKVEDTSISCENIMGIWESLARFQYQGEIVRMGMLPEWLRSLAQSSMKIYSQNVRGILEEAKVHAEIRLLAYYENEHVKCSRPRILAASKKACALCNTIITIHGEYRVPKSHGRLYKGWRLPAAHQIGALQDRLNVVLENTISTTLERLIPLTKRPAIEFDNESSIYSFSSSESTLSATPEASTISYRHSAVTAAPKGHREPDCASCQPTQSNDTKSSSNDHSTAEQAGDENEEISAEDGMAYRSEHTGNGASSRIPRDSISAGNARVDFVRQPAIVKMKPGQKILFNPEQRENACFQGKRIELLIDEASSCFAFELLCTEEAEAVLRDETKPKADVRAMSCEMEVLLQKSVDGQVYISHGEEVIKICANAG